MRFPGCAGRVAFIAIVSATLATGCLPYTVGSTARTAPPGTLQRTGTAYSIPGGIEFDLDSTSVPLLGMDLEMRYGIDEYSDIGLRIPMVSGIIINYKRRLNGRTQDEGTAYAVMAGGGFVNAGEHALLELSFLASGKEKTTLTPYGGLRSMYVLPLTRYAESDQPTAGGFLGMRLGTNEFGVSPEIGVYYDPSTLELRQRKWIFVPGISLHLGSLFRAVR